VEDIKKDMFESVGKNLEAAQKITRPSMSYMEDALRRIKKNKPAVISFWILIFMITMSLVGPIVSKALYGHTYRKQDLDVQNQTMILSNKRSIMLTANTAFTYSKYNHDLRKTKISFKGIKLTKSGIIAVKVGNKAEEAQQGDQKEFRFQIKTEPGDTLEKIAEKLNTEAGKQLEKDAEFRGVDFKVSGSTLTIESKGEKAFNKKYWFGTDTFGRDIFTRVWEGGRVSFMIAFIAVFVTSVIGIIYGGISGYIGGTVDNLMMRFVEVLLVVPDLLYIILLLQVMKPGIKPIIIVLAGFSWMGIARIVRGEVMRLKHSEYVLAAETIGASKARIIFRHLIPNTMGPIIVQMTMMVPAMIFTESFLSFIGLGIPAPFASWGSLVNEGALVFVQYPNTLIMPAVALSLTMLGFNILGDGLRDALDPKLRK
jgi:oligopeptide transport system permease protein